MPNIYDTIIIGCGPAGMTAGLYLLRANKRVLILESETIGGQMSSAPIIENYPGFSSIVGSELADQMFETITNLNVEIELEEAKKITPGNIIKVETERNAYECKTLIIATGAKYRTLGLPKEEDLIGSGIHFCVSCDGAFYKDKVVAVVGGSKSALGNALMLSTIAKKVYLIHHNENLRADAIDIERLKSKDNVEFILNSSLTNLTGNDALESITLNHDGNTEELKVDGVFLSIGTTPTSALVKDFLEVDERGFIKTENTKTKEPNIFVAGDCRDKENRQITIATADGTNAAISAINYLNNMKD